MSLALNPRQLTAATRVINGKAATVQLGWPTVKNREQTKRPLC